MAIKTGTITARFTKVAAYNANTKDKLKYENETGPFYNSSSSAAAIILCNANFSVLSGYRNLKLTGLSLAVTSKAYGSTAYENKVRFVTDFDSSNGTVSDYTDLGDGSVSIGNPSTSEYTTITTTAFPNTLSWLNSNLDRVLNDNDIFGVRVYYKSSYVLDVSVVINYEYEETEYFTVSTAVSPTGAGTVTPTHQVESGSTATVSAIPNTGYKFSHWLTNGVDSGVTSTTLSGTVDSNITITAVFVLDKINKIVCDTSKHPTILIDTQVVKAILIDTTKVYG